MEFTDIERLAIAQAFQKAVGEMVSTKNPDNLRGRVDAQMKEVYESSPLAPKSFDVNVMGQKVGSYSLTVSKPREQTTETGLEITDIDLFSKWAMAEGCVKIDMDKVERLFAKTGIVPDGCTPLTVVTPADEGGKVTRATLKVDPEKVSKALGPNIGEAVRGMLEGGEDVPRFDR